MFLFYGFCIFSIFIGWLNAQEAAKNSIIVPPGIMCGDNQIVISIETMGPFGGNIYSRGFFNKKLCRVQGNGIGNVVNITIPINADCGMRRRRILNPRGIVLETTVMIMFHKMLLTKHDRSFHVECKYMENNMYITQKLDVSSLPTTEFEQESIEASQKSLPKCSYEVLYDNENGRPVQFATIGQPIYHKWSCEDSKNNMVYCLTVHSCKVDDGQGNAQELLDSDGCSIDKSLLEELEYKTDLQAGKRAYVFKFADQATIYFSCQLRLEVKTTPQGICERSSDHCSKSDSNLTNNYKNLIYHDAYDTKNIKNDFSFLDTTNIDLNTFDALVTNSISKNLNFSNDLNWPHLDDRRLKDDIIRRAPTLIMTKKNMKRIHPRDSSSTTEEPLISYSHKPIEMDVTAGSVNVIEVPESQLPVLNPAFDSFPRIAYNYVDHKERICLARNSIYIATFVITFILLIFMTSFCYVLLKLTKPDMPKREKRRIDDSILAFDL